MTSGKQDKAMNIEKLAFSSKGDIYKFLSLQKGIKYGNKYTVVVVPLEAKFGHFRPHFNDLKEVSPRKFNLMADHCKRKEEKSIQVNFRSVQ